MSRSKRTTSKSSPKTPEVRCVLGKEERRVITYWRRSLLEGRRREITATGLAAGVTVPVDSIPAGQAPGGTRRDLAAKSEDARKSEGESLPVLICPLSFSRQGGSNGRSLELVWVPALLSASGKLAPPRSGGPWIARSFLEPAVRDDYPTVGTVERLAAFDAKFAKPPSGSWADYWSVVDELVRFTCGEPFEKLRIDGHERRSEALIVADSNSPEAARALLTLFDEVLAGKRDPGLLPRFARADTSRKKRFKNSTLMGTAAATRHCGQFGGEFALAPSQRRAVHRVLSMRDGEALAVTGPPGTGKTTLLQSIIASMWIRAIVDGATAPPVIAVCGATNQSVTNVIDCFSNSASESGPFTKRWLPGIASYGTFCSSATKARDAEGYLIELMDGSGVSARMSEPEYLSAAKRHYLDCYSEFFDERLDLKSAVDNLRYLVNREFRALSSAVKKARSGSLTEWIRSVIGLRPAKTDAEFFHELEELDTVHRHRLFLLASHYWEGRWLIDSESESGRPKGKGHPRFLGYREDWQRRAMITPAFVSTLFMLPRFFMREPDRSKAPLDLLIFDEASQISTEVGAGCMTLARRALIVGDRRQLKPVWSVTEPVDFRNAELAELLGANSGKEWRALTERGILASNGSLMTASLEAAATVDDRLAGTFLSEHRRSVPEIIAYCNELAYDGKLEPKRPSLKRRVIPPLGFIHVEGRSTKAGESRFNAIEADAIVRWLEANAAAVSSYYEGLPPAAAIAVVSPFTAQIQRLKPILQRKYPGMTVGTVHSLQGAERPIVLFSTVYDRSFRGEFFFDRTAEMLNVAVSRAKDSFVVVGDMNIFDDKGNKPSALLARYLLSTPGNELHLPERRSGTKPAAAAR